MNYRRTHAAARRSRLVGALLLAATAGVWWAGPLALPGGAAEVQAQTACHLLEVGDTVPAGYGAPYDVVSSSKDLLVEVACDGTKATVSVGSGASSQYVYRYGYQWKDKQWQRIELAGSGLQRGAWYPGQAQTALSRTAAELSEDNYVVAYVCIWTGAEWKCGCRDQTCAQSYWQIQGFSHAGESVDHRAPYPASKLITGITWSPLLVRRADGSDNWPITWADDDALYTAYGDGWGFEPNLPVKLSLGFAKVTGAPPNVSGTNIRSASGERTGDGASGEKASGLLMVDGTLYMWARNANRRGEGCRLAWSKDRARMWTWSSWGFSELGYCTFLNFGRNYAGARDGYVYTYSPNTRSAYNETDEVVLARVPKERITDQRAYEFFAGRDGAGSPIWSEDITKRASVFTAVGHANRLSVTHNAPLGRYLMTMRSRARAGGRDAFGLYEAPAPWGPWRTVYYSEEAEEWGEAAHIPSKWISADGTTLHLVYSGDDSFSVRRATLTIGGDGRG